MTLGRSKIFPSGSCEVEAESTDGLTTDLNFMDADILTGGLFLNLRNGTEMFISHKHCYSRSLSPHVRVTAVMSA